MNKAQYRDTIRQAIEIVCAMADYADKITADSATAQQRQAQRLAILHVRRLLNREFK